MATVAHEIPVRAPLRLAVGDEVQVGERDAEWPAFVFVTAAQGSGWVPARHLSACSGPATVVAPYDTTELPTQAGEELDVLAEDRESGWVWCRSASGRKGWVPVKELRLSGRPAELRWERDGVESAGLDFGGAGPSVLLLHGLAGHAGEWAQTAGWLTERARVVALDARGHGRSERRPDDVSRAAHVADAVDAIERLGLAPAVVVGHSLGAQTALLLAAERPDLVRGVMVRTLREAASHAYWKAWERIACPVLVIFAERGIVSADHGRTMVARAHHARLVEIAGAGHDVHLDRPEDWRRALTAFFEEISVHST